MRHGLLMAVLLAAARASAQTSGFGEVSVGFVPNANDVPVMLGLGARFDEVHELWARFGWFTTGDDVKHPLGVVGYRFLFRAGKRVRPFLGALAAGLTETCYHDAQGRPSCTSEPLFVLSAHGGVRFEPVPWLGFSAGLLLGADTYPNPFGMVELGVSVTWPR